MSAQNLAHGYKDGSYRPDQHVTRAEVAAFLHRYHHLIAQQQH
ncbi:S-layer homology domain-containing protein [Micrococcus terreus]|nr:S-layer homology domain-containing protein [Micrococcus terreus]MCT2087975.1 S-layer homology domain-containing protein [Micrococcus terreus]